MSFFRIGYPETVFKLAYRSFQNCFRRLPRRAYGTARNDDKDFRQPESNIEALSKKYPSSLIRLDETTAHYSLLTAHCLTINNF
ncbi:MAG: hypothetical protein IJV35_02260 [Neisseriaceae bacterium]|nr:hypothetical protein [Neisseriaceae bacterium]